MTSRADPAQLGALVRGVDAQCEGTAPYDLDANLAVLKLYQFNPSHVDVVVVSKILLKALMRLPNADFNLCMYLLNEQLSELEEITRLVKAHDLLQTAKFAEFWAYAATLAEHTKAIKGFADAVRQFIALTVSITFQKVNLGVLAGYLHMQGDELHAFVKTLGWTVAGDVVTVALNDENQAKPMAAQERIKFDQLTRIIGYAASV